MKKHIQPSIEVLTGPMFSGKTEALIRLVNTARNDGYEVQIFYPKMDTRNHFVSNTLRSHGGLTLEAKPVETPQEILVLVGDETQVVAIDEVQFFDNTLSHICEKLVEKRKKVILAGLDRDFRARPFETVKKIITKVRVIRLRAPCAVCKQPADFTQRIIDGKPAPFDSPLIMVGGNELYEPRCGDHFFISEGSGGVYEASVIKFLEELDDLPGSIDVSRHLGFWIDKLQAIARTGLGFSIDAINPEQTYDQERYEDLLNLAAEMRAFIKDQQIQLNRILIDEFYGEWRTQVRPGHRGYITPKITVSGAVFNNKNEILLVRKANSQYWDLPGGWCDTGYSAAENIVKEFAEETGLNVTPINLIGIYDSQRWGYLSQTQLYSLVFYCQVDSGMIELHPVEIVDIKYFGDEAMPSLLPGVKVSIQHAFDYHQGKRSDSYFDLRELSKVHEGE